MGQAVGLALAPLAVAIEATRTSLELAPAPAQPR